MRGSGIDETKLELRDLRKSFDGVEAVKGSNLVINRGEFLSLLGPSGCGKSTTLAMIAGFVEPTSGQILVDGQLANDISPQKRRIGLVFQDYAIFTRLTVLRNLHFGLEAQNVPRSERTRRVDDIVAKLNLASVLDRRGGELNMSEMQRVALARVLVTEPALLLLDEPMSNLDSALRESLRRELKEIQQTLNQTVLYVTHDQLEAMAMSDRIAIMNHGEILQVGSPEEIYHRPVSRFVAEFIGDPPINMVSCVVARTGEHAVLSTAVHQQVDLPRHDPIPGSYLLGIRPQHIRTSRESFARSVPVQVELVEFLGAECVLHMTYDDDLLRALVAPGFAREGDTVHVAFDMQHAHLIDPDSSLVIAPDESAGAS